MKAPIVMTLVFLFACGSAAAEMKILKCRGGKMKSIGFQLFVNGDTELTVSFIRGTKPASQGLAIGECSWEDKAMATTEFDTICDKVNDVFISTMEMDLSGYNPSHRFYIQDASSKRAFYLKDVLKDAAFNVLVDTVADPHCFKVVHVTPGT